MAFQITDGEVSAIHFFRVVRGKAPEQVKSQMEGYISRADWSGLAQWSQPLQGRLQVGTFNATEVAEVAPLSQARQDVYLFLRGIEVPAAAAFKERVDRLREWGAWEAIAKLATSNPKIPFQFTGADVRAVLDPSGSIPEMTLGQTQAKTFLNTIATDANLAGLKAQVAKLLEWGGYESVAAIVNGNDKIPFKFTADEVRAVAGSAAQPRGPEEIKRMMDVWGFYGGLETAAQGNADVAKFFNDIKARVQHGCWKSIADLVNGNDKIPFKGFDIPTLKAVLDPTGQYGEDDACSALAPPVPPAWTKPITWSIGAGLAAYSWTTGAAGSVADWTTGAYGSAADWTTGAAGSAADWTTGAAGDVADWTVGAGTDAIDWTTGAGDSVAGWTTGAANDTANWTTGAAGSVADWTTTAASDAGDWAKGAAETVADSFNPSSW